MVNSVYVGSVFDKPAALVISLCLATIPLKPMSKYSFIHKLFTTTEAIFIKSHQHSLLLLTPLLPINFSLEPSGNKQPTEHKTPACHTQSPWVTSNPMSRFRHSATRPVALSSLTKMSNLSLALSLSLELHLYLQSLYPSVPATHEHTVFTLSSHYGMALNK